MSNKIVVSNEREFKNEILDDSNLDITEDNAETLWEIWTHRFENGADESVLIVIPRWFSDSEFDMYRPLLFGRIEHDGDNNAILFSDTKIIDINIVKNDAWDSVTMTEVLTPVDKSDTEYVDETGKIWIPESHLNIYEIDRNIENVDENGLVNSVRR